MWAIVLTNPYYSSSKDTVYAYIYYHIIIPLFFYNVESSQECSKKKAFGLNSVRFPPFTVG